MVGFPSNYSQWQWARALAVPGALVLAACAVLAGDSQPGSAGPAIDKTPATDLLPAAPKAALKAWSPDATNLAQVPELAFWDPLPRERPEEVIAGMTARINAANRQ